MVEAEAIHRPIQFSLLIRKVDMQVEVLIMVDKVETQAAAHIVQKETNHRKPATPALPVVVLVASSEMTVQSQAMALVAT